VVFNAWLCQLSIKVNKKAKKKIGEKRQPTVVYFSQAQSQLPGQQPQKTPATTSG